ncbi:hypothetical protein FKP32DRAFT_1673412 [Trametes sanguinea]|nr:hypothetical protein FKP32DRAFT_1673412 [Trametes sanguinea]
MNVDEIAEVGLKSSMTIDAGREQEGFLPEDDHVRYNHTNRLSIIAATNTVSHGNFERLTQSLADLLAPNNGGNYFSNSSLGYDPPRTLFLWEKRHPNPSQPATFVIHFKLFSTKPYAAHHLALLLLHFTSKAVHAVTHTSDERRPKPSLQDIVYALGPNATYGSLFYKNIEDFFEQSTIQDIWWSAPNVTGPDFRVSTWPEWTRELADVNDVLDCAETATALAKV